MEMLFHTHQIDKMFAVPTNVDEGLQAAGESAKCTAAVDTTSHQKDEDAHVPRRPLTRGPGNQQHLEEGSTPSLSEMNSRLSGRIWVKGKAYAEESVWATVCIQIQNQTKDDVLFTHTHPGVKTCMEGVDTDFRIAGRKRQVGYIRGM